MLKAIDDNWVELSRLSPTAQSSSQSQSASQKNPIVEYQEAYAGFETMKQQTTDKWYAIFS